MELSYLLLEPVCEVIILCSTDWLFRVHNIQ